MWIDKDKSVVRLNRLSIVAVLCTYDIKNGLSKLQLTCNSDIKTTCICSSFYQ